MDGVPQSSGNKNDNVFNKLKTPLNQIEFGASQIKNAFSCLENLNSEQIKDLDQDSRLKVMNKILQANKQL